VATPPPPTLRRALGRGDLTAFAVNRVIGGGIFGIPAVLYLAAGPWSVWAIVFAGLVVLGITLCFAEVGSAFEDTGGPYLYAYETFGPAVGFEIGWLMWVTQLGGFAAVTNLFVDYLGWFAPALSTGLWRIGIITGMVILLTAINILGVRRAGTVNNIVTLAKLVPLALFVAVGLFFVDGARLVPAAVPAPAALSSAVLLAIYAFSGFEVLGAMLSTLGVAHAILLGAGRMPVATAERRQPASRRCIRATRPRMWASSFPPWACSCLPS
jgi:amino acid transporter